MITIQKYVRAQSLEEAWELNQARRNRIVGGMLWLKMSQLNVATAIDLCDLGLDAIEETDEGFSIGAMVSLRALEQHEGLARYTGGLVRHAVEHIVGVQLRNMATVGGSLWGRFGFSEVLTAFLAMDAQVELHKGGVIPLEKFAAMKPDRDVLVRLIIRKTPGRFAWQAVRNQRTDFPVLCCAASQVGGEYRVVIGARPGRGLLLRDESGLLEAGISPESAARFAADVAARTPVGSNHRASAAYRTHLIRVLVQRAITELGGNA